MFQFLCQMDGFVERVNSCIVPSVGENYLLQGHSQVFPATARRNTICNANIHTPACSLKTYCNTAINDYHTANTAVCKDSHQYITLQISQKWVISIHTHFRGLCKASEVLGG